MLSPSYTHRYTHSLLILHLAVLHNVLLSRGSCYIYNQVHIVYVHFYFIDMMLFFVQELS